MMNFLPLPLLAWMLAIPHPPRVTYTVSVGNLFHETNCISVTNHEPDCTLVTYINERGQTNEFHAWLVPVKVETNGPAAESQQRLDAIQIFVGPGTELCVTVPSVPKHALNRIISAFLADDPKATTNFEKLLGKSSALTLILTTKPAP